MMDQQENKRRLITLGENITEKWLREQIDWCVA